MKNLKRLSISIVNLNCLGDTKELISDLDRQNCCDFDVYIYDQNSSELGTKEFLQELSKRSNYTIIQNGRNKPLNHIWNSFAESVKTEFIMCLNNDIRVPSNYIRDTLEILEKDSRVGIAVHATNNRRFSSATSPTRHVLENTFVKQGWEFCLRLNEWTRIPEQLKFYCGDDFIFGELHKKNRKVGVITSSPVIHKLSKTRQAMSREDADKMRSQANTDIATYKQLGYTHVWNNIPKQSRLKPEFTQIIEIISNQTGISFEDYAGRLQLHLNDLQDVNGIIVDAGLLDNKTFETLVLFADDNEKHVVGIDYTEYKTDDYIAISGNRGVSLDLIKSNKRLKDKTKAFSLNSGNYSDSLKKITGDISFAFIPLTDPIKLNNTLSVIWDNIQSGGTIFFPNYYNQRNGGISETIDEFFADKNKFILKSRPEKLKGILQDNYLAIKCFKTPMKYIKNTKPLTIATVLKLGGDYDETYVNKLAAAIKRHTTKKYKFACLTDADENNFDKNLVDDIIPLELGLASYWSKLELFRPELFSGNQVLYFDLDTLIIDNIDEFLSYGGDFMGLRNFNNLITLGSGILGWDSSKTNHIFYKFVNKMIADNKATLAYRDGDQQAIHELCELKINRVQDLYPKKMCAFKYECYIESENRIIVPDDCSVICFHSKPKMLDLVHDPIIIEHWS